MSKPPAPSNGGPIYNFWASWPCGPSGWLALLLMKAGDVETNPGPTTANKLVWICDICYKQIHVGKQISIRCMMIEHWVHLRCVGIRQEHHLPSTHIIQTHISPPNPSIPWSKPLPSHHLHHPYYRNPNTDTRPKIHLFRIDKAQTQTSHPLTPSTPTPPRAKHIHISHISHFSNSSHPQRISCARYNT